MKKTKITIHKINEIVRGTDMYSLNAKRCFNAIYYIYQKNREITTQSTTINISYKSLRELMNLERDNNYVETINQAIEELQTTLIKLNNFKIDDIEYKWYSTKFLNDANVKKNNEITVNVEISTFFKKMMISQINFTKLDLVQYLNKFRTKYAMKLYEYLKSFNSYRYIDITQSHLMILLNIDEDNKTYKNFAQIKRLLLRQLKELVTKSDLKDLKLDDSKEFAKDKVFRIMINSKAKKRTAKKEEIEEAVSSAIKRF